MSDQPEWADKHADLNIEANNEGKRQCLKTIEIQFFIRLGARPSP
jgi:hypothetical protein